MLSDYIKEKEIVENSNDTEKKIIDFFSKQKEVEDAEVHKLADGLGLDPHKFEEKVYSLLTSFWSKGRYNEKGSPSVNISELEKGIKIEMEHTDNEMVAKRIALDHLAEIPDYYTRLIKMEKEAMDEKKELNLSKYLDEE